MTKEQTIAAMREVTKSHQAVEVSFGKTYKLVKLIEQALALLEAQEWVTTKEKQPEIGQKCIVAHPIAAIGGYSVTCCEYLEFGFPLVVFGEKDPLMYWHPIPPLPTTPSEEG